VTGVGPDGGIARRTHTVSVEESPDVPEVHAGYVPADDLVERSAAPEQAGAFAPTVLGQAAEPGLGAGGRYAGRRIDLDLKDADIHNVLRLLADVGRVNIVAADDVKGTVTIRMRNVPWDQALDIILQSKGLGITRQGNMIRVAPLERLEKEREMRIARQKQELQLAPLETRIIPVSYANAVDIQARAQDLLSSRGSIAVDERTNVLIVRDVAGNLNQVEELTRTLDTQTPQVLIEARIVEATSRYLRDVGIQWGGDATFSAATGNPTGLAFPNSVGVAGGASDNNTPTAGLSPFTNSVQNPNFAVNLPAATGTGAGGAIGLTFGSVNNTVNLAVRLSAAESSGMLRILSSPRILTLDNKEARISQGTLIPFSQVSAQGVQTTFQEAKLQLLVRPHVTADGSVSLQVKINRDEPDFNQTSARGDPTILKREAETNLLVMDGHTAVIGGIYTRNSGRNLDQVPFFGDIPLLGILFQRRRASDSRGELVIFLTPRIVNRAEALGR
jgi:type IV pilus assembly protein PilQ